MSSASYPTDWGRFVLGAHLRKTRSRAFCWAHGHTFARTVWQDGLIVGLVIGGAMTARVAGLVNALFVVLCRWGEALRCRHVVSIAEAASTFEARACDRQKGIRQTRKQEVEIGMRTCHLRLCCVCPVLLTLLVETTAIDINTGRVDSARVRLCRHLHPGYSSIGKSWWIYVWFYLYAW